MAVQFRVGHGYDLHRLQVGGRLLLGGVVVAEGISPVAHSDGDVVLHALVDAILGALGRGDIGDHFPDSDPRWRGADSARFVAAAVELAGAEGLRVVNADVTVLAERPRLGQFKPRIAARVSALLDGAAANVKAGTHEGCDAVGRGEAIAAHAVVLLAPA